jgi:3-hydroxy-3-methylglutaryl CoA synthase
MTTETGILGYGAYIPQQRLQRSAIHDANKWFAAGLGGLAKGEKAVSNWDEDSITMAVEAARDCLENHDRDVISNIYMASTTHVFADRQNAGVVKEALNLDDAIGAMDTGGSMRAGTSSLLAALRTDNGATLHLASERRIPAPASEGEMMQGDAAAALLVGQGEVIARLVGSHSVTADFVDHFREAGEDQDYGWEARWIRDEGFGKLMAGAITGGSEIDHFIAPIAVRKTPEMLAKKTGISETALADVLGGTVGHAGSAHPTVMLSHCLEQAKPGAKILLTSFGQGCDVLLFEVTDAIAGAKPHCLEQAKPGAKILLTSFGQGCDVLLFEVTDAIAGAKPRLGVSGWLKRRRIETNYMKYLFFRDLLPLDRGMRAEQDQKQPLTALWRNRKAVMGLVGGRCTKTGSIQFPMSEVSVNPNDHAVRTQEDYPLADVPAKIMTYTADALTYSPEPPSYYGNIEFEGGGRMMAEFTDVEADAVEVGADMRMVFRIKALDEQRHFRRYFWKAAPAS